MSLPLRPPAAAPAPAPAPAQAQPSAPSPPRAASSRPGGRPTPAPDPPAHPTTPRPAEQAADAIAALRHIRTPAAVLESALHLAQALLDRPAEDPLLLEAAEGLAAVIPQYLAAAHTPAPGRPAEPRRRLQAAPTPTTGGTGTLRA
ncbi:hypothetical protein OG871_38935 [Kitasatospora sp. NBC_00374]|uniref:hypothetical protein n=1 Tax=Kitasatospora sp. NBC_00374 TaxID=2975964 RepID=UPI0030DDF3A0